jgi:Hsp70 protein
LDACRNRVSTHKSITDGDSLPIDVNAFCPPGMITVCSCSPGRKSYESDLCKSGIFTEALVRAVGPDGRCGTIYKINEFIKGDMPRLSKAFNRPLQTPFIKVEPIEPQNIVIVRDQLYNQWKGQAPFGNELRTSVIASLSKGDDINSVMAVDFGTINSLAALHSNDAGTILVKSTEGRVLVQPIVKFRENLSYVVGEHALARLKSEPNATIGYIKRLLGSDHASNIYSKTVFPHDIAALIIKSLKSNAEELSGSSFSNVVASVPINFLAQQEHGLLTVLKQAGFDGVCLIPEPCAAALVAANDALCHAIGKDELKVLVIDVGGDTSDLAAVDISRDFDELLLIVESVDGDPKLGGINYDLAVAECIRTELKQRDSYVGSIISVDLSQIIAEAERAKILINRGLEVAVVLTGENNNGEMENTTVMLNKEIIAQAFIHL